MADKKKQYYLKDKKAQVYKSIGETTDPIGQTKTLGYMAVSPAPLWCYSKQLSQTLIFVARAYDIDENRLFVFNYNKLIKPYDYIEYKGSYYQITRVDTTDGYNSELFAYVKDSPRGGIDPDRIINYDPEIAKKWT